MSLTVGIDLQIFGRNHLVKILYMFSQSLAQITPLEKNTDKYLKNYFGTSFWKNR